MDHIFIPLLQEGALRMASEDSRSSVLREFPGGPGVSPERDSIAVPPLATPVHRPSHLEDETDAFW